jgi:hypothetical protein
MPRACGLQLTIMSMLCNSVYLLLEMYASYHTSAKSRTTLQHGADLLLLIAGDRGHLKMEGCPHPGKTRALASASKALRKFCEN